MKLRVSCRFKYEVRPPRMEPDFQPLAGEELRRTAFSLEAQMT